MPLNVALNSGILRAFALLAALIPSGALQAQTSVSGAQDTAPMPAPAPERASRPAPRRPQAVRSAAAASAETSPEEAPASVRRAAAPRKPRAANAGAALSSAAASPTRRPSNPVAPPKPRNFVTDWPTGKKLIALTYDDGPNPKITPKLLDLLREKKVPATFFVIGENAKLYPDLIKRELEEGFEIANHSWNHPLLSKLSEEQIRTQLQQTNDAIEATTGKPVQLMRPPYGAHSATVDKVCAELGLKIIIWDVDTNDWRGRSAAQIISTIEKESHDGSIILMHDRLKGSLDASGTVIDDLRAKGYTFVSVGELLAQPRAGHTIGAATGAASTKETSATTAAAPVAVDAPGEAPEPASAVAGKQP